MPAAPNNGEYERRADGIRQRASKKLEGFSPLFELAVAVSAVIGVFLLAFQIYYMRESNRLVQDSLRLTRESNEETRIASDDALRMSARTLGMMADQNRLASDAIAKAERQAEAGRQEAARLAESNRADANATLEAMKESNRITREAAAESNRLTRDSNELTEKGMRRARRELLENRRPEVTAMRAEDFPSSDPGLIIARVVFKNTGKVPVKDAVFSGTMTIADFSFQSADWGARGYSTILMHTFDVGEEFGLVVRDLPQITGDQLQAFASGEQVLYAFGWVHPGDDPIKQRIQHLFFCFQLMQDGIWTPCHNNNYLEYDRNGLDRAMNPKDKRDTMPGYEIPDAKWVWEDPP